MSEENFQINSKVTRPYNFTKNIRKIKVTVVGEISEIGAYANDTSIWAEFSFFGAS